MTGIEATLTQFLMELSHHPYLLFTGVILILIGSSFGLPLPEEVVLLTAGMIANLSLAEAAELGGSPTVDPYLLSAICFLAVFGSDLLVFTLGRMYGISLLKKKPINRFLTENALDKVEKWTHQYGAFACCVFRFTPGIRFPGHFMCGALKISYPKFFLTDGVAALLTVPTQVLLLAFYGDEILVQIKQFKIAFFSMLAVGFVCWIAWKLKAKHWPSKSPQETDEAA